MITECYIKGRFDNGVGKCAVVIKEGDNVVHQVAWKVPASWDYNGEIIKADQFNCEIMSAVYAVKWCMDNDKPLVNIYANTKTCQKWYQKMDFPEGRDMGACYGDMVLKFYEKMKDHGAEEGLIFADFIPKKDENIYNVLVNKMAMEM